MLFQPFRKATAASKVPNYMEGAIALGEHNQAEKEAEIALKQQYASGGLKTYDAYNKEDSSLKAFIDSLRAQPAPETISPDFEGQPGAQNELFTEAAEPAGFMGDTGVGGVAESVNAAVPSAVPDLGGQAAQAIPESAGMTEAGSAFSEATVEAGLAESMATETAQTAMTEALAAGATEQAALAAGEAAIAEMAATTAATTAGAGGAATGASAVLAAMGPVGWAALAAGALAGLMG